MRGFVDDVRLFTTAGFVLTNVDNGRAFLDLPGSNTQLHCLQVPAGRQRLRGCPAVQALVPEHDVLTARRFHDLGSDYWETVTGSGR